MLKPNTLKIESILEESCKSQVPPLDYVDSPIHKKTLETHEFLTEETLHMKSTPNTQSSFMPLSSNTFYGKIKDSVIGLRQSLSSKILKDGESVRNSQEKPVYKTEKQTDSNFDPYEINSSAEVPTLIYCAHCRGEMTSETKYVNTSRTFWSAVAIFFAGGVAGCFLCPYLSNRCKSRQIVCSRCNRTLQS